MQVFFRRISTSASAQSSEEREYVGTVRDVQLNQSLAVILTDSKATLHPIECTYILLIFKLFIYLFTYLFFTLYLSLSFYLSLYLSFSFYSFFFSLISPHTQTCSHLPPPHTHTHILIAPTQRHSHLPHTNTFSSYHPTPHTASPTSQDQTKIFPAREEGSYSRITCVALTDDFLYYGTEAGTVEVFFLGEYVLLAGIVRFFFQ